jgi:hypothetical protein
MIEHEIGAHPHPGDHRVAERVGAEPVDDVERVDAVA